MSMYAPAFSVAALSVKVCSSAVIAWFVVEVAVSLYFGLIRRRFLYSKYAERLSIPVKSLAI